MHTAALAQVVCSFCEKHLEANQAAFKDTRLKLIIDDARAQLEQTQDGSFDVIIGDLADPVFGGPCYQACLLVAWLCTLLLVFCRPSLCALEPGYLRSLLTEQAYCILQLYTQEFYQTVVKQKLAPGGVFVTQSGPAGVLSATQVN